MRELSNAVERAVVMSSGNMIFAEDLPLSLVQAIRHASGGSEAGLKTLKEQVRSFEARVITQALERNQANRSRTANELGISRRALLYKLHELDLDDGCAESDACCE